MAVLRNDSNIAKIKMGNLSHFRAIQGHSGGIPVSPELKKYTLIPYDWKKYRLSQRKSMFFQSILESGIIPGGKEEDKARQAVFLTPLNPSGKDPEKEKPHSDFSVPQKVPNETKWKRNQDAVHWVRLKEAQEPGLQFWRTKSFAIMTYFTIPGDCIDALTV